jgi:pilus assembly protein CpaC
LAEPTIVALSGEQGTFLVGGKVFIPIPQSSGNGTSAITLEEREFGVGLRFIPTVLDAGRINLKVEPEVSQLSKEPINFGVGQSATLLPSFTSTKVSTTVQLRDGQSLVIGGLLRNSTVSTTKAFPFLGEIPILGALFRSNDFAKDMTELLVVVRPHLVSATDQMPQLPTDKIRDATRAEMLIEGALEKKLSPETSPSAPATTTDKDAEPLARELRPGLNRRLGSGSHDMGNSNQSEADDKKQP